MARARRSPAKVRRRPAGGTPRPRRAPAAPASPRRPGKAHVENERRRRFVEHFMANGGNATQAALRAGYSPKTATQQASRLLRFVNVQAAIQARRDADPVVMSRQERQAFWTAVAQDPTQAMPMRLRASELLGKSQADFVEVRMAPIVTDPQSSEADLIKSIQRLLAVADERAAQDAKDDAT